MSTPGMKSLKNIPLVEVISENKKQRNWVQDILIRSKLLLLTDGLLFYMLSFLSSKVQRGIRPDSANNYLETKFLCTGKNVHNIEHKVEICSIFFKHFS